MNEPGQFLKRSLEERNAVNASYSLRAFARDLGLSPQLLSNVINGNKGLSLQMAQKISSRLGLSVREAELFCSSVQAKFSRSSSTRELAAAKLHHLKEQTGKTANLEIDLFKSISNWYHYGLISLLKIAKSKKNNTAWMSARMGIPEAEVKEALARLVRLELLSKGPSGWTVNQDTVIADQGIPNEAIRNFHRQILEKSIKALAFQNSDERYGSSSTFPIKAESLPKAKKMIQDFRLQLAKEVGDMDSGEEVYALSVQFFKLTETLTNKEIK